MTRTILGAALVFGLAAFTDRGQATQAHPPTSRDSVAAVTGNPQASVMPAQPRDGASYQAPSPGEPRADNGSRVHGRSDWDVDYPSQLGPQALH